MHQEQWIPDVRVLALILATFGCLGAVPGDVGGCGEKAVLLDAELFYSQLQEIDCQQCRRCSLLTQACRRACDDATPIATAFPKGCQPLVHDGEVCLRALEAASCRDYAEYAADVSPSAPTECDFCPPREER